MIKKLFWKRLDKGFLLTLLLSLFTLVHFFGPLLKKANSTYFASSGDGLQAYYNAIYQVKHNTSYIHYQGLNYPYGDNIFYTGAQPFVSNSIKLVSNIIDISDYTVGILNLIMLLSIPLCALFLYLILREFKLPSIYSALVAVGITFLSPQINRMGGHFSLTYQFAIPCYIYLLIRFYRFPTFTKSLIIASFSFFMIGTHAYFLGFFGLLSLIYWLLLFISKEAPFNNRRFCLKHFFIQLILPVLLFQIILFITDSISDRTSHPWGLLAYKSKPEGVFYPYGMPYENLVKNIYTPKGVEWEGVGYIGLVSCFITGFLLLRILKHTLNKDFKKIIFISENNLLNILFWSSVAALLYGMAVPFELGLRHILNYLGPIKQMRGLGRFIWLYFYIINIVAFYIIYHRVNNKNPLLRNLILAGCVIILFIDAYSYSKPQKDIFNNNIEKLNDKSNLLPSNKWIGQIDKLKYQAILPLPFFHIGSENFNIAPEGDIMKETFIASLKTGLPSIGSLLSRTSISQAFNNISIVLEPYRPLDVVQDYPSKKPILVLAREDNINENEKKLLQKCSLITTAPDFNLYELNFSTLENFTDSIYAKAKYDFESMKAYKINQLLSSDSLPNFIYKSFDDNTSLITMQGTGAYQGLLNDYNRLYSDTIPGVKNINEEYVISFWVYDIKKDMYPRTTFEMVLMDSLNINYQVEYAQLGGLIKTMDGKWGLIEYKFTPKHFKDKMQLTIWNDQIKKGNKLIVDDFLVRPLSTQIYRPIDNKTLYKNNRILF